jgi:uncharacterized protein DUF262
MATGIKFELTGIGALLASDLYRVPIYQRSYAWEDIDVEDFWHDLKRALATADPEYFLGTVVLTPSEDGDRIVIIDGQQRLATTTILLAVLRDIADDQKRAKLVESINNDFLYAYDYEEDEAVPRLVLNAEDDAFFRIYIVEDTDASLPARLTNDSSRPTKRCSNSRRPTYRASGISQTRGSTSG